MQSTHSIPQGLWLPLITPFRDSALDEASFRRLVQHYAGEPVDGFILAATTGEGLTLDEDEAERLVCLAADEFARIGKRLPLYLGLSGSWTNKCVKAVERSAAWPAEGYLIACPYYTRPSQGGLYQHFLALADASAKPILIYNIPYRTGVNLANETMLRLAENPNIIGAKDCCVDMIQSFDLMRFRPAGFSVLTGEDALYYAALTQGADGGILASAHIETQAFADIREKLLGRDKSGALAAWRELSDLPRLLFSEPSPAAIKYWLWRKGVIGSPELRLPMTSVSDALAGRIDREIERRNAARSPNR